MASRSGRRRRIPRAPRARPRGSRASPSTRSSVHVMYLGCGWGRRSSTDFVEDAVEASMKAGAPVQVLWTREEDMQHDNYRPATHVRMEGGLDAAGKARGALRAESPPSPSPADAARSTARRSPGSATCSTMCLTSPSSGAGPICACPVGYWRSVGPSQNVFVLESFIDELAATRWRATRWSSGARLLAHEPRMLRVLNLVAERSGWGGPRAAGSRSRRRDRRGHAIAGGRSGGGVAGQWQAARAQGLVRRRLRPRDPSRHRRSAVPGRDRRRTRCRALRGDHDREGPDEAVELQRLPPAADERHAARSTSTSCRARRSRAVSANPAFRRSRRRCATRCSG